MIGINFFDKFANEFKQQFISKIKLEALRKYSIIMNAKI